MKIYVAAPYAARELAAAVAEDLIREGHIVTSTWLKSTRAIGPGTVGPTLDVSQEDVAAHAQGDFDDIDRSDLVLMLTLSYCESQGYEVLSGNSGGRHVECGYAWGTHKAVHILGDPENVFGRGLALIHPDVKSFLSWVENFTGRIASTRPTEPLSPLG